MQQSSKIRITESLSQLNPSCPSSSLLLVLSMTSIISEEAAVMLLLSLRGQRPAHCMKRSKSCANCSTNFSPMWRHPPFHIKSSNVYYCNACYIYSRRHNGAKRSGQLGSPTTSTSSVESYWSTACGSPKPFTIKLIVNGMRVTKVASRT